MRRRTDTSGARDRGGVLNGPITFEVEIVERIPAPHVHARIAAILQRMLRTPVAPDNARRDEGDT